MKKFLILITLVSAHLALAQPEKVLADPNNFQPYDTLAHDFRLHDAKLYFVAAGCMAAVTVDMLLLASNTKRQLDNAKELDAPGSTIDALERSHSINVFTVIISGCTTAAFAVLGFGSSGKAHRMERYHSDARSIGAAFPSWSANVQPTSHSATLGLTMHW